MDRLSIFRKGLLLIAVPLVFQILFIASVVTMRRHNLDAERWTIHSNAVIAQAEACGYQVMATHGAIQGYIITKEPSYGVEVRRSAELTRGKLRDLVAAVADNPVQAAAARRFEDRSRMLLVYNEEGVAIIEAGQMSPPLARERRLRSQELLDEARAGLARFVANERELNEDRRVGMVASWRLLDLLLMGGMVLSILASLLVAILFSRSISGRIEALADNARLLSEGRDLMPSLHGTDEIARLDGVFRQMAGAIAAALRRERADAEATARVNEQLREKAQENEMFVYSVSHDLRSPLVNLQGFSKELGLIGQDLLRVVDRDDVPKDVRKQARSLIAAEMAESVGFIQSAVTRLSGIIDALLRLSRAGRVEYRPQEVAVAPVVARIVAALRGTIDERGARVVVEGLPAAVADPTALEQVLANLIGNAVNYLDPDRPGVVTVSAVVEEAGGPHAPDGPMVVYTVADNGLGIPEAYQGKIFGAFQRLHGDRAKGEGIGLALCRRAVERHGGRIWFASEAGRGTAFSFSMPAAPVAGRAEELP